MTPSPAIGTGAAATGDDGEAARQRALLESYGYCFEQLAASDFLWTAPEEMRWSYALETHIPTAPTSHAADETACIAAAFAFATADADVRDAQGHQSKAEAEAQIVYESTTNGMKP